MINQQSFTLALLPPYQQSATSTPPLLDLTQPRQGPNVLTSCPAFSTNHVCVCLGIWHQPSKPSSFWFFTLCIFSVQSTDRLPSNLLPSILLPFPFEPVILLIRPTANWAWNNLCSRVTAAHPHRFVIHWQDGLMGRRKFTLLMSTSSPNGRHDVTQQWLRDVVLTKVVYEAVPSGNKNDLIHPLNDFNRLSTQHNSILSTEWLISSFHSKRQGTR